MNLFHGVLISVLKSPPLLSLSPRDYKACQRVIIVSLLRESDFLTSVDPIGRACLRIRSIDAEVSHNWVEKLTRPCRFGITDCAA